jgi:hypothetical protein
MTTVETHFPRSSEALHLRPGVLQAGLHPYLSAPVDKGRASLLFDLCETARFHQVVARIFVANVGTVAAPCSTGVARSGRGNSIANADSTPVPELASATVHP